MLYTLCMAGFKWDGRVTWCRPCALSFGLKILFRNPVALNLEEAVEIRRAFVFRNRSHETNQAVHPISVCTSETGGGLFELA